jgi:hypothetical protein
LVAGSSSLGSLGRARFVTVVSGSFRFTRFTSSLVGFPGDVSAAALLFVTVTCFFFSLTTFFSVTTTSCSTPFPPKLRLLALVLGAIPALGPGRLSEGKRLVTLASRAVSILKPVVFLPPNPVGR